MMMRRMWWRGGGGLRGGWKNCVAAELAYQTHGEGWRLGTGADVDLHIRCGGPSGACAHRCVGARARPCM